MNRLHLLIGIVLALFLTSPLRGQAVPYAITNCSTTPNGDGPVNYPVIHYRSDLPMTEVQAMELTVHEKVHVAQLQPDKYQTCQQKLDSITATPMSTLLAEVPAYCAQLTWVWHGTSFSDFVTLRNRAAQLYAAGTPRSPDLHTVAKAFKKGCPSPDGMDP